MKKGKNKSNSKMIIFVLIAVVIIVAGAVIIKNNQKSNVETVASKENKEKEKKEEEKLEVAEPQNLEKAEIDTQEEAYSGREFYQSGEDIIIQGENGSKTISTKNQNANQGMKEVTEEEKNKYEISNVNISEAGGQTIITGKITNKAEEAKDIIITAKFYSDDGKIKGATNSTTTVNPGETQDFTMKVQDQLSKYKSEVFVEYTN